MRVKKLFALAVTLSFEGLAVAQAPRPTVFVWNNGGRVRGIEVSFPCHRCRGSSPTSVLRYTVTFDGAKNTDVPEEP